MNSFGLFGAHVKFGFRIKNDTNELPNISVYLKSCFTHDDDRVQSGNFPMCKMIYELIAHQSILTCNENHLINNQTFR